MSELDPVVRLVSWAGHVASDIPVEVWVVSIVYLVVAAAVVAEVAWRVWREPRAPQRRAVLVDAWSGAVMTAGALAVGVPYAAVLVVAWAALAPLAPDALVALWAQAPVLGFVAAFIAWDLAGFVYHAAGHHTRVGWASHQVHHSAQGYDLTVGLRQTWFPVHGLAVQPFVALAGFDLSTIVICAAVSNGYQLVLHAARPIRLGRVVEAVVMTPASHRHHHRRGSDGVNLGPVLTVWDRLAGTWRPPDATADEIFGPPRPAPTNPVALELGGWLDLARDARQRPGAPAEARSR
ncbi:MAG TPA: sterol desaturase family protein [Acidimicrobiales bacterium]|nr:sterol desaturase family protein [Acidimicrobiales bacterium]